MASRGREIIDEFDLREVKRRRMRSGIARAVRECVNECTKNEDFKRTRKGEKTDLPARKRIECTNPKIPS